MNDLKRITTCNCPFTGRPYDCGKCETCETLEPREAPCSLHLSFFFDGCLADGKRGMRQLHSKVGGKSACTLEDCSEYFWSLHGNGVLCIPVGGGCDRFCYRRGCMGHRIEGGERNGE